MFTSQRISVTLPSQIAAVLLSSPMGSSALATAALVQYLRLDPATLTPLPTETTANVPDAVDKAISENLIFED